MADSEPRHAIVRLRGGPLDGSFLDVHPPEGWEGEPWHLDTEAGVYEWSSWDVSLGVPLFEWREAD